MFHGHWGLARPGPFARGHDPEIAIFLQPAGAFVTQQRSANLAGIVAQADCDHLKTFRMLVAAEAIGEEIGHTVSDSLDIASRLPDSTVRNGSTPASSGLCRTTAGTRSRQ